eukprot:9873003-Prorocentrum_lima.AAC.1
MLSSWFSLVAGLAAKCASAWRERGLVRQVLPCAPGRFGSEGSPVVSWRVAACGAPDSSGR